MSSDSRRIIGADGVRALACLIVLAHHLAIAFEPISGGWLQVIRNHGSLSVSAFFVLSGMLLSRHFWQSALEGLPWPDVRGYIWARMARIVPAYFVCLLVSFALFAESSADSIWRLASSLSFLNWTHWRTFHPTPVNAPLWSIGIEVCFYAMLPVWALGLRRVTTLRGGLAYIAISMTMIVVVMKVWSAYVFGSTPPVAVSDPLQADAYSLLPAKNPLSLFAHFLFGCAASGVLCEFKRRPLRRSERRPNRYDALAFGCLLLAALEVWPSTVQGSRVANLVQQTQVWFMFYRWPIVPALMAALLVSLHQSVWFGPMFENRFLCWTAKLSYGLYLWHQVVIRLMEDVWPASIRNSGATMLVYAVAVFTMSYIISAASYCWIEIPALDWLKRRRTRLDGVFSPAPLGASG